MGYFGQPLISTCTFQRCQIKGFPAPFFKAHSQKCDKRLLVSSCLSARMEHFGAHWMDFMKFWYLRIFRKTIDIIKTGINSNKNNEYLHKDLCNFMLSYWIVLRMRNVPNKSNTGIQNTHFIFYNFSWKSCRLWDNVGNSGIARQAAYGNIIRRRRGVICMPSNLGKNTDKPL